jgi:hypothetical protein
MEKIHSKFESTGEIGKFCGHGCKDLHEVEQAPFQCYECASDLCNTNTDTESMYFLCKYK